MAAIQDGQQHVQAKDWPYLSGIHSFQVLNVQVEDWPKLSGVWFLFQVSLCNSDSYESIKNYNYIVELLRMYFIFNLQP